jgi:hypothetical protein
MNALMLRSCALMLTVIVTGCCSSTKLSPERPPLPANLTQPCPDLTALENGKKGTVQDKFIEVGDEYARCQQGKQALVDAVTKGD